MKLWGRGRGYGGSRDVDNGRRRGSLNTSTLEVPKARLLVLFGGDRDAASKC
jgi:hypothetical protein